MATRTPRHRDEHCYARAIDVTISWTEVRIENASHDTRFGCSRVRPGVCPGDCIFISGGANPLARDYTTPDPPSPA